ncbi:MAG: hypothetical protein ACI4U2_00290 [Christensenellaceae bacterium]
MRSLAVRLAISAAVTALLIAVQYALGFVAGVELVTVLLLSYAYAFGWRDGMITATAFSLLRCIVWGFYPAVLILYLIYYNLFALFFGWLGSRKRPVAVWVAPVLLSLILVATAFATAVARFPLPSAKKIRIALWILFSIVAALLIGYLVLIGMKKRREGIRQVASVTALAATFTISFTLLDDLITSLFFGYTLDMAITYFYGGFFAMIPQTLCTIATVGTLFYPLMKIFNKFAKKI